MLFCFKENISIKLKISSFLQIFVCFLYLTMIHNQSWIIVWSCLNFEHLLPVLMCRFTSVNQILFWLLRLYVWISHNCRRIVINLNQRGRARQKWGYPNRVHAQFSKDVTNFNMGAYFWSYLFYSWRNFLGQAFT